MDSPAWRRGAVVDPLSGATARAGLATSQSASAAASNGVSGTVLLLALQYAPRHCPWGWLQLAGRGRSLAGEPGLRFCKVMGSGHGGGFTLRPSASHQGLLCMFDQEDQARAFARSPPVMAMLIRSRSHWMGLMSILSARGSWDGVAWRAPSGAPTPGEEPETAAGPVAVLTRASIRPLRAWSFWRHAPAAQMALREAQGCELAMGLGEAPLLRQCTFSLWRDPSALEAYARQGAHGQAAMRARSQGFFSESMFVRLRLLDSAGRWPGTETLHG